MIAMPEVRLDTITSVSSEHRGRVVVAGSHGGRYCGYLAARAGVLGVILNDASIGRDDAGIGSLDLLAPLGIPAATVAHDSARIGDAADMSARGRISHCNEPARLLGCEPGQACAEAVRRITARPAPAVPPAPPAGEETRFVLRPAGEKRAAVIGCDSASLVRPEDEDCIVVTGSHCGILPGRPGYGLGVRAGGAVFNDAGGGAGTWRLAVLDTQGIPGTAVAAASARIGEARSTWETGVVSAANDLAAARGVRAGMTVPEVADRLGGGKLVPLGDSRG